MNNKINYQSIPLLGLVLIVGFFLGMLVQSQLHPATMTEYHTRDEDEAKGVLITFLDSLHNKNYAEAAVAYGGAYDQLRDWNPDVTSGDSATLWQRGCEMNGLNCLEIRNVAFASQPNADTFIFHVWFSEADKVTEFSTADDVSMFDFTVVKDAEGKYSVITMPVYTP